MLSFYRPPRTFPLLLSLLLLGPAALAAQEGEDVEGAEDHPIVSRYEGSYIAAYEQSAYERAALPAGREDNEVVDSVVEGEITRILYAAPEGLSALQVHRNYQIALRDAGFEIVYECVGGEAEGCNRLFWSEHLDPIGDAPPEAFMGDDHSYFLARMAGAHGDVFVSAHTVLGDFREYDGRPVTGLQVVEEKPMPTGKVTAKLDAAAMAEDLSEAGTVRLYGIHFDTDEATIKPGSEATLAEIGALLQEHPDLRLAVVGHTDVTGTFEHNMDLSRRRAEAVVEHLTTEEGIAADRLEPHGVGPLAPVATNETEEGRARNRRVELVKLP